MKIFKGVCYSRVSTQGQVYDPTGVRIQDGSLDSQKRRVLEYLDHKSSSREKYEVTAFLEDAGISGKNTKRPAYKEMWDLIKKKKVNFIIATEISRLSRSTKDFINLMDHCKDHDVDLIVLRENFDTSTMHGKMLAIICALFSELERVTTIERQRENTKSRLKTKGRINGANEILGLDRSKTSKEIYEINEEEVEQLVKLLNLYLTCDSRQELLREANRLKIYDKNGKAFTRGRIDILLFNVNWRYRGLWFERDSKTKEILGEVPLPHGKVVDLELLDKVSRKIESDAERRKNCGRSGASYLLTGLLFDKRGNSFSGAKGNGAGGTYYYYYNKVAKVRINAREVEDKVQNYVLNTISNSHYLYSLIDKSYRRVTTKVDEKYLEYQKLTDKYDSASKELTTLKKRLKDPELSIAGFNVTSDLIEKLEQRKEIYNIEKKSLLKDIEEIKKDHITEVLMNKVKHLGKVFLESSQQVKRNLLQELFEKIIVIDDYEIKLIFKQASDTGAFLFDVILYKSKPRYEDLDELKRLYIKKGMSLRQIAIKMNCSRTTIYKKLSSSGVEIIYSSKEYKKLRTKIKNFIQSGESLQMIADRLNLWKVPTRSGKGKWYPKTVKDLID